MTMPRMLSCLLAALLWAAGFSAGAADSAAAPASAASTGRSAESTKARQEAERQRLIAKLRSEAPTVRETQARSSPLDLPIFRRHDRP